MILCLAMYLERIDFNNFLEMQLYENHLNYWVELHVQ